MSFGSLVFNLLGQFWYYRKLWFFTSFGIAFMLLAYLFSFETLYLSKFGERTEAVVVQMEEKQSKFKDQKGNQEIKTLYTPVVRYKDFNGRQHTVKSKYSTSSHNFGVDDTVIVYYHTDDPRRMAIDEGFWRNYLPGIIFSIFGFLALIPLFGHILSVFAGFRNKVLER